MTRKTITPREALPIVLGQVYRERVLGIEAVATGYVQNLSGGDRVCLEWIHDGRVVAEWFDVTRIEVPRAPSPPGAGGSDSAAA